MQLAKGFHDIYFPNHLEVDLAGSINMVYYYQFPRKLQPQKPLEHTQWPSPNSTPKCFRNSKSSNCCWNRLFFGYLRPWMELPQYQWFNGLFQEELAQSEDKGKLQFKNRECMLQRPVGKILDLFKVWTTLSSRFTVYLHPRCIFIGLQTPAVCGQKTSEPAVFSLVFPSPESEGWGIIIEAPLLVGLYIDDALANQAIFSHLRKWERKQTKGNIKPYKPQVAPGVVSMILPLYILLVTLRSAACSVCIKVLNCGWTKHNTTTF